MKTAPLIVGLLVFVTAGCERRMVRVQSPEPASTPSFTFGPTPDPNRINWEQRAKQIHIGMRRTEVERLLPPYSRPTAAGEDFRRFATDITRTGGGKASVTMSAKILSSSFLTIILVSPETLRELPLPTPVQTIVLQHRFRLSAESNRTMTATRLQKTCHPERSSVRAQAGRNARDDTLSSFRQTN